MRFHGFLKVSLEEVLIALRDDADLLRESAETLDQSGDEGTATRSAGRSPPTFYPEGFDAATLIAVIEGGLVWA